MNSIKHKIGGSSTTSGLQAQNPAIYNSNNQKMVEPLSNRAANAPNHAYFAASGHTNEQQMAQSGPMTTATNGGQAILREVPLNLQKSGEIHHCKVDR